MRDAQRVQGKKPRGFAQLAAIEMSAACHDHVPGAEVGGTQLCDAGKTLL